MSIQDTVPSAQQFRETYAGDKLRKELEEIVSSMIHECRHNGATCAYFEHISVEAEVLIDKGYTVQRQRNTDRFIERFVTIVRWE